MWRFFNFKKKKLKKADGKDLEGTKEVKKIIDENNIIDITKILTEDDKESVEAISLLVKNKNEFKRKFEGWLNEYDFSVEEESDIITAYLLTGFNADSPYDFGAFIDWKEHYTEIIWSLKNSIVNKKYELYLDDIIFSNDECGEDALNVISGFLVDTDFILVHWDTGGDCYHLFIIHNNKWNELIKFGNKMDINFYKIM